MTKPTSLNKKLDAELNKLAPKLKISSLLENKLCKLIYSDLNKLYENLYDPFEKKLKEDLVTHQVTAIVKSQNKTVK